MASHEKRLAQALAVEDALARAKLLNKLQTDTEDLLERVSEARTIALALANDRGVTQVTLGKELGFSKARAQQLIVRGQKLLAERAAARADQG